MRRSDLIALLVPGAVALLTLAALALLGPGTALAVLAAGAAALIAFHLRQFGVLARWAAGPLDAPVPEGRGIWQPVFAALYRRVRTRIAYERDLAQTIERFASAAEAIPDGMVVIDAANRIRWANARGQRLLGLDLARDRGHPLVDLVRHPAFVAYIDAGDFSDAVVLASQRDPGVMLAMQIVPFAAAEKLLIARDITRLEAVARMRRDFIANVSHELKTPLTVIAGFIETLQDLDLDARARERSLELMHEQARNMQRLVDDLLTLSALESDDNVLYGAAFPAAGLIAEVSASARALSGGRHAIVVDVAGDADALEIVGSRDELASAFSNLVSNAIRYTPDGGTITIRWRATDDGGAAFAVADTGIGIAAEHLPRLTERFYRVDRSRSRATGGTGLGLAIVKHVLHRHQAELRVVSEPGTGSTFTAMLPTRRVHRIGGSVPPDNRDTTTIATSS